jgi:uncharacterized protein with gpF-like domain
MLDLATGEEAMSVPETFRKSITHRKLWGTMKFLAEHDSVTPIVKGEHDREVIKAATERRRTILEHEAADKLKAYFRAEQKHMVREVARRNGSVDQVLDAMKDDLTETLHTAMKHAALDWGTWSASGRVAMSKAKGDDKQPKPIGYALDTATDAWLAKNLGKKITGITETSRKDIAAQILEGTKKGESLPKIAKRIDKFYLESIIPNRSMVIARTEVGAATSWAQHEIAQDSDVPLEKEWLSQRDQRVRETHRIADGQRVGLDDPFIVGESELQYPRDPAGDPEEIIQCRCDTLYHVVDESPPFKSVSGPYEFAKSVLGIENPDVITSLAFMKGVFREGDDWIRSREILMGHVHKLRRSAVTLGREG